MNVLKMRNDIELSEQQSDSCNTGKHLHGSRENAFKTLKNNSNDTSVGKMKRTLIKCGAALADPLNEQT